MFIAVHQFPESYRIYSWSTDSLFNQSVNILRHLQRMLHELPDDQFQTLETSGLAVLSQIK